jgi:hypothetical protein
MEQREIGHQFVVVGDLVEVAEAVAMQDELDNRRGYHQLFDFKKRKRQVTYHRTELLLLAVVHWQHPRGMGIVVAELAHILAEVVSAMVVTTDSLTWYRCRWYQEYL